MRHLDPRIDRGECDIHGARSGRGATAKEQMEAGAYIHLVKSADCYLGVFVMPRARRSLYTVREQAVLHRISCDLRQTGWAVDDHEDSRDGRSAQSILRQASPGE